MRLTDLTHAFAPGFEGYRSAAAKTKSEDGWNARELTFYSHAGTHMDAPRHFIDDGPTLEQLDLGQCVGPCRLVNLAPIEPRALITVESLGADAEEIRPGERLLLRSDWHKRRGAPEYRHGLPRVSEELARWFAAKPIAFLGVEPPSVADVNSLTEVTLIHEILLGAGIVIAEGLRDLDKIREPVFELVALPLKIEGGDGCPARVIALERD